jgi:hypothetical protein
VPRMILHKLSTQRVKRCTKVREDFSERSRRPRNNSRRLITILPGLSDSPE